MQEFDLATRVPECKKVLIIGQEGSGKTHLIGTFPKPIFMFSFDKGYDTLAGIAGIKVATFVDENREKPVAYREFEQRLAKLMQGEEYTWADGRKEVYKTIAIDSITFLSNALFDHVQALNSNVNKKASFNEYQIIKSMLQDVLTKCLLVGEYVAVSSLIKVDKDDLTGEVFFLPNVIGSTRDDMGAWFDAVFFSVANKSFDGKVTYKINLVGDSRRKAKIRIPSSLARLFNPEEEADFQVILEKLKRAERTAEVITSGKNVVNQVEKGIIK